jgi:hypothetical protein
MVIKKAILKNWFSSSYTATVQIAGSSKVYLEGVKVARNIPAVEMVPGRKLAVLFWNASDSVEAVVIGVYG